MKGKKLWNVLLVGILAFALGLGTMALYTRTFTSNNNVVGTAKFKVSSNGTLDGDGKFEVLGDRLFPGADLDVYDFQIDKRDTEVPVKYTVSVTPVGDVFGERAGYPSPLKLTVLRETENGWVDIGGLNNIEIIPEKDKQVENFKIHLEWPHNNEGDIYFEDLGGSIHINVVAQQIVEEEGEPDPGDPEPEPTIKVKAYVDINNLSVRYIDVEVENIEGADQFEIEYKVGDINPRTVVTEKTKMGAPRQELPAVPRKVAKGDIRIFDEEGNFLYEFKSVELIKIF